MSFPICFYCSKGFSQSSPQIFLFRSDLFFSFRRFVMPALALCACAFMVYAAFAGYGVTVLYYLVVYAAVMGIGWLFDRRKK